MRPSSVAIVAVAALTVTGCSYSPGSFRQPTTGTAWHGERATAGCLDVALEARASALDAIGQVVVVQFANRCDRAVTVDFTQLRATGHDAHGVERALAVHDPNSEVRPLPLEARTVAREVVELRSTSKPLTVVRGACVDIASLVADAPSQRWVCVAGQAPSSAPPVASAEVAP